MAHRAPGATEGAGGDGWRERIEEELWPRPLRQHVAQRPRSRDESAGRTAERLPERRGDDVHFAQHTEVLGCSASGLAEHTGAVRVVDSDDGVILTRDLQNIGQLCDASLHREDT